MTPLGPWYARYVGLPFQDGGRGPDAFDCWGLLRDVYARELGVMLPSYGEISAHDLVRIAREMEAGKDDGWRDTHAPGPFDVCLMRAPRGRAAVVHVGVMIDGLCLLHTEAATGAVVVPFTHATIRGRVLGYRRRV